MAILVVGSVAFDSIETPHGKVDHCLGGAATHFSLANQYTEQLSNAVRAAVLGNAGTLMVFHVSAADAVLLAPELHPLPAHELVDQSPHRAWLRRGDSGQRPVFVSPRLSGSPCRRHIVIAQNRRNFGRPRALIERSSTYPRSFR